jgi:YfiH family protein
LERFPWLEHGFGTLLSDAWPDAARLAMARQVHSTRVLEADGRTGYIGEADALIANRPGLLIGIRTADCVPILLADARRRAVASVHAGWRGTAGEIARHALEALRRTYGTEAADVHVAIGPAIGPCCYEVGPEVARRFAAWFEELRGINRPVKIDLPAANRLQLIDAGVPPEQIYSGAPCTFCAADQFYSYRREGSRAGRMIAAIGIRG